MKVLNMGHFVMIKESIQEEIPILRIYPPNNRALNYSEKSDRG